MMFTDWKSLTETVGPRGMAAGGYPIWGAACEYR